MSHFNPADEKKQKKEREVVLTSMATARHDSPDRHLRR